MNAGQTSRRQPFGQSRPRDPRADPVYGEPQGSIDEDMSLAPPKRMREKGGRSQFETAVALEVSELRGGSALPGAARDPAAPTLGASAPVDGMRTSDGWLAPGDTKRRPQQGGMSTLATVLAAAIRQREG